MARIVVSLCWGLACLRASNQCTGVVTECGRGKGHHFGASQSIAVDQLVQAPCARRNFRRFRQQSSSAVWSVNKTCGRHTILHRSRFNSEVADRMWSRAQSHRQRHSRSGRSPCRLPSTWVVAQRRTKPKLWKCRWFDLEDFQWELIQIDFCLTKKGLSPATTARSAKTQRLIWRRILHAN